MAVRSHVSTTLCPFATDLLTPLQLLHVFESPTVQNPKYLNQHKKKQKNPRRKCNNTTNLAPKYTKLSCCQTIKQLPYCFKHTSSDFRLLNGKICCFLYINHKLNTHNLSKTKHFKGITMSSASDYPYFVTFF